MSIIELKCNIIKYESDSKKEIIKNFTDKLYEALELIDSIKNPNKIVNSQDAYEKLCIIRSGSSFYQHIDDFFNLLLSKNFIEIITNTLVYISDRLGDKEDLVNFNRIKIPLDKWKIYDTTSLSERLIYILSFTIQIINSILPNSLEFAVYLSQKSLLNSLLSLIKNESLINYLTTNNPKDIDTLIYIFNWISRYAACKKRIWLSLNSINALLDFSNSYPKFKRLIYMIIANIATDNQIESYDEIKDAFNELSSLACDCINQNSRRKIQLISDDTLEKDEFEICYISDKYSGSPLSIISILVSLYRLSINEELKFKLIKNCDLMKALRELLFKGIEIEKEIVLQIFSQLCFNENVRNEMSNDEELLKYVESLLEKKEFDYKKLARTSDCFLWIIDELNNDINDIKQIQPSQKHIMISYHDDYKEVIIRIKDELEKENFRVWINDDAHNLDSMRKGIENCDIFIACITEKYRQSIKCRAEAEYAFNLKKNMVFLAMQKGYEKIDGWIGSLYEDSLIVLSKNSFDYGMKNLSNEIREIKINSSKRASEKSSAKIETEVSISPKNLICENNFAKNKTSLGSTNNLFKYWNESETNKWFLDSNIDHSILNSLKPINGENLYQLYQIQLHIPEFFFRSIIKDERITLKAVMQFSTCLKNLYENQKLN